MNSSHDSQKTEDFLKKIKSLPYTKPTKIIIMGKVVDVIMNSHSMQDFKITSSLYAAQRGEELPFYIFSENVNLDIGSIQISLLENSGFSGFFQNNFEFAYYKLRQIDSLLPKLSENFKEEHFIRYINEHRRLFLQTSPIKIEDLKKLSKEEHQILIQFFIYKHSMKIDKVVKQWAKTQIYEFDLELGKGLQKYNSHSLVIKNTKCGFTTQGKILGECPDKTTLKTLEGIGMPKEAIMYSPLHKLARPFTFDEFGKDAKPYSGAMDSVYSYMETGSTDARKGGKKILSEGLSAISFVANPQTGHEGNEKELAIEAYNTLRILSNSPEAGFSRLGLICVGNYARPEEGEPTIDGNTLDRIHAAQLAISKEIAPYISLIFKKLEDWLCKRIEQYEEELEKLEKADNIRPLVLEALRGAKGANKHMRGASLKLALLDFQYELLHQTIDLESEENLQFIKDNAEFKLQKICETNLDSFRYLLNLADEISNIDRYESRLKSLKKYQLALLVPLAYYGSKCMQGEEITIEDIEQTFNNIPQETRANSFGRTYSYFSKVRQTACNPAIIRELLASFDFVASFDERAREARLLISNNLEASNWLYITLDAERYFEKSGSDENAK